MECHYRGGRRTLGQPGANDGVSPLPNSTPHDAALDSSGNVFVAERTITSLHDQPSQGGCTVARLAGANGAADAKSTAVVSLSIASGLPSGNLFVATPPTPSAGAAVPTFTSRSIAGPP